MSARLAPGTLLADTYRVVRLVGVGGMGEVYEASHARLPGRYAVKVLLGDIVSRGEILQRFRREAEVTSGLRHPNIVQVLDFNVTADGSPYLVMEFLDGIELAEEIRRVRRMPIERALDIVGQIASGLAAAHSHKVVHRDLKPQNMFLVRLPGSEREVVKMVDFGISKVREATIKLTMEEAILGTPQYMAPEQAQGKLDEITERTDQFALAAITYELLAGRPAFGGGSVPSILYQVVHQQPAPLAKVAPDVGPAVEAVVFRALAKKQADRYPSVLAFHAELVHAAATDGEARTVETPSPLWLPGGDPKRAGAAEPVSPPRMGGMPAVAPTALIPPTAATAQIPAVAPTARIPAVAPSAKPVPPARRVQSARLAPGKATPPTPPRAAAARLAADLGHPSASWWLARFGALAVLVLGAGGAYWFLQARAAAPTVSVAPAAGPGLPPPTAPLVATPKPAKIEVENRPPGLRVTVDGVAKELPILLPGGPDVHTLLFEADGYLPTEVHVDGRESRSIVLAMKPEGSHGAAGASEPVTTVKPKAHGKRPSHGPQLLTDF